MDIHEVAITEQYVLKQILEYLRIKGYFAWRNNTGGFSNSRNHFYHFGKKGSGDIFGLTKEGKFFSIEVKRKGKKPSPDQETFITNVRLSNGLAFVAYSVEDVLKAGL